MDLSEAIVLGKQALDLRSSGHPLRSTSLNNVATYLSDLYDRIGDIHHPQERNPRSSPVRASKSFSVTVAEQCRYLSPIVTSGLEI